MATLGKEKPLANFNFAATACLDPGNPFFPGGYHDSHDMKVSIATESSSLVMEAFTRSSGLKDAMAKLQRIMNREFERIEESVLPVAGEYYGGIDVSPAPSLERDESIAYAFEHLIGAG